MTERFSKRFSKDFLTPHFGLFRKAKDFNVFRPLFTPPLAPFRPRFGLILGSFLAPFWALFGLFLGPFRGRVLSGNTTKQSVLELFGPPKDSISGSFSSPFGPVFAPFRVHFGAPFGRLAEPHFHSLGAGLAGPWGRG